MKQEESIETFPFTLRIMIAPPKDPSLSLYPPLQKKKSDDFTQNSDIPFNAIAPPSNNEEQFLKVQRETKREHVLPVRYIAPPAKELSHVKDHETNEKVS